MALKKMHLVNFRNYEDYQIDFSPITIFIGPNGVGKTNLLESIYLLATTSSYRVKKITDLVRWNSEFSRIVGSLDNSSIELIIDLVSGQKTFKIFGTKKKSLEIPGYLPAVLFSSEQIETITGSPQTKRKFLNIVLAQTSRFYTKNLLTLQKILSNRNRLLQTIKEGRSNLSELDFWDNKLWELNRNIVPARMDLVEFINKKIKTHYQQISHKNDVLQVRYLPKLLANSQLSVIKEIISKEIRYSCTLLGPHRDELVFLLNGKAIEKVASRGELRSATLALKISEIDYLSLKNNKNPLLLLDDIFSELDQERRKCVSEIVKNFQTIITTTDRENLDSFLLKKAKIVELRE